MLRSSNLRGWREAEVDGSSTVFSFFLTLISFIQCKLAITKLGPRTGSFCAGVTSGGPKGRSKGHLRMLSSITLLYESLISRPVARLACHSQEIQDLRFWRASHWKKLLIRQLFKSSLNPIRKGSLLIPPPIHKNPYILTFLFFSPYLPQTPLPFSLSQSSPVQFSSTTIRKPSSTIRSLPFTSIVLKFNRSFPYDFGNSISRIDFLFDLHSTSNQSGKVVDGR